MSEGYIQIEILGSSEDSEQKSSNQTKAEKKKDAILYNILHPIKATEQQLFKNSSKSWQVNCAKQIYDNAKESLLHAVDYSINRSLSLSEDYLAENQYRVIKGTYQKISGAYNSIANGAIAGATIGGPAGAVAGAFINLISWGVREATSQAERWSNYNRQLNAINFNTQFNAKRAGLYDGGRGAGY